MFGAFNAAHDRDICQKLFDNFDNLVPKMKETSRKYNFQASVTGHLDHTSAHVATSASRRVLIQQIQDEEKEMHEYHEGLNLCKQFIHTIQQNVKQFHSPQHASRYDSTT